MFNWTVKKIQSTDVNIKYNMVNIDGCADQYICSSALYLMYFMLQYYSIIIDRGISAPRHDKEVVDSLNSIYRGYIYQLTYNVQLTGSKHLIHRF